MQRNRGPTLSNNGSKLANNGPKLGNNGPKLVNLGPKRDQNQQPGIYEQPIGEGKTGRDQKMANPCSDFRNTLNTDTIMNNERVLNTEIAFNKECGFYFKSSDDILEVIRTHPDFSRLPKDYVQPLLAGILSSLLIGGGAAALFVCSGGTAVGPAILLLRVAGSALQTAGVAGLQKAVASGIKGNFSWHRWSEDVAISAGIAIFTFGPTLFTGYATSTIGFTYYVSAAKKGIFMEQAVHSLEKVKRLTQLATTVVSGLTNTAGTAIKKIVKMEKVDPVSLIASLVSGALSGYSLGSEMADKVILEKLKNDAERILSMSDDNLWVSKKCMDNHVKKHWTKDGLVRNTKEVNQKAVDTIKNGKCASILSEDTLMELCKHFDGDFKAGQYSILADNVKKNSEIFKDMLHDNSHGMGTMFRWQKVFYKDGIFVSLRWEDGKIITCYPMEQGIQDFEDLIKKSDQCKELIVNTLGEKAAHPGPTMIDLRDYLKAAGG